MELSTKGGCVIAQTQNLMKLPKMLNFVLGLILISASLIFMFTDQHYRDYQHLEPVLVLMSGFLSLMAAFSNNRKTGYRINLSLGCFYLGIGLSLSILLFNQLEWFLTSVFGFTAEDVLLNIFLGIILLVLSYFYRSKRIYDSTPGNFSEQAR
jgi:hypothetical protein